MAKSQGMIVRTEVLGAVGRLVLDRPGVRNALNLQTAEQIIEAVDDLEERCDVIVVSGAGGTFCAGADLPYVRSTIGDRTATRHFLRTLNDAFDRLSNSQLPVIAQVEGYALAGGFELMQACDIVVVADDARIGDQHANFGLLPGAGGSQRLPRLIGRQLALSLLLSGDWVNGPRAVELGLAYLTVPAADLPSEVTRLADRVASHSRVGLAHMKRLVDQGPVGTVEQGIDLEIDTFLDYLQSPDPQEGLVAFTEKRAPVFSPPPPNRSTR